MTRRARPEPRSDEKRAAIYTRKSNAAGLEQSFNSLDAQREACEAYIARQAGWTLVDKRYDDGGFTGANIDRPAFRRLLADIDAKEIDVVVVYKVDRLSRSLLDFVTVMERFNAGGAAFVSVTQNFSTADAMGRLTFNMLMSFAEFEREMIAERTRDKIAASRRKGMWTGGVVPLGYTVERKKLVVHELEAILVREIFTLFEEHRSTRAVTRALADHQRVTKRYRFYSGRVREARPWTDNDVLRVLRNPVYAGCIASGNTLYPGEHTPLIERARFDHVQALMKGGPQHRKLVGRNPAYLLRGILRCACCGSAFTTASTSGANKTHRYYRCVRHTKEGPAACPSPPLPAVAIENYVIERVREATADGTLVHDITEAVRARVQLRRQDLAVERQKVPPEVSSLSSEVQRVIEAMTELKGTAKRAVEDRLEQLVEHRDRLQARLAAIEHELGALDDLEVEAAWVAQALADFDKVWDVLTPENRVRLVRAVIQRVDVDEPANKVSVFIADLSTGATARAEDDHAAHTEARR